MQRLFLSWAQTVLRTLVEALSTENARLERLTGKKKSSLWDMNKAELKEKAQRDLGMTESQLEKETVTSLRERLRSQRDVVAMLTDPLAKTPKGLDSLLKEELKQECIIRQITLPEPCTRPKMIVLIKDDIAVRMTLENQPEPENPDWEMSESSNTRRRR